MAKAAGSGVGALWFGGQVGCSPPLPASRYPGPMDPGSDASPPAVLAAGLRCGLGERGGPEPLALPARVRAVPAERVRAPDPWAAPRVAPRLLRLAPVHRVP